jgi:hypothetical protein
MSEPWEWEQIPFLSKTGNGIHARGRDDRGSSEIHGGGK